MNTLFELGIIVTSLIILYFAYFTKSKLATLIVYVILGAVLFGGLFSILAGIEWLEFLRSAFNTLGSLIVFVEIALIIFFMFFKMKGKNSSILRITTIILLVLLVLVELNIF